MRAPGRSGTSNGAPQKALCSHRARTRLDLAVRSGQIWTPFAPHTAISEETPFCAGPLPRDGPVEADFCEPGAFGLGRCRALSALQDRKGGQANHPLDGSPSLFAHLSGALRAFQTGASRTRPVPLCRCATFPPRCGGIFPRPRRVYAPASVGALFVRHWRTAPFEKAGETFHVCQSYRTLF